MASINRKDNSPYWMAKFRDETGRIVMRSTKQTDPKKARKVAEGWEDSAKKARNGELTRATALKVLAELVEKTTGEILVDATAKNFFTDWLNSRKAVGRASGTVERYRPIVTRFLNSLGQRADKSIRGVTSLDLTRFRDSELSSGKSAVTANLAVKVLKAAFERAKKTGLILTNPASELEGLEEEGSSRQPFSDSQVSQLLTSAPKEWRGMILLGVHLGLRMSDAANLQWAQLDLENDVLTFTPKKTRRSKKQQNVSIALHSDVSTWLKKWREDHPDETAVFPSLVGRPTGSHTGLSNEFGRVMTDTGIQVVKSKGSHEQGRKVTLLSFHSLRHSCVSRLANADVSADVRKTISRHSTDEAHSRYTHLELETQRRALLKVGSLLPS